MNFKTLNHSALAALMLFSCSWLTSCSDDDDNNDGPMVEDVEASDFEGVWQDATDRLNLIVFNSDKSFINYYLDEDNNRYYEEMNTGTWKYDTSKGYLSVNIDGETEKLKLKDISGSSFTLYDPQEKEDITYNRISQSQLPIGPATGSGSSTHTDTFTNTTWAGNVDGADIILAFKPNGVVTETFRSEVLTGTYSVSGVKLVLNLDGVIRNSYGTDFTFTKTATQLTLVNEFKWKLVFTKK